jgi:hypothetical protein
VSARRSRPTRRAVCSRQTDRGLCRNSVVEAIVDDPSLPAGAPLEARSSGRHIRRSKCRLRLVSTTIRVSEQTRDRFAKLADTTGRPMTQLLDEAADALERRVFFDRFSTRYDELRADPVAWDEIESERSTESGAARDSSP